MTEIRTLVFPHVLRRAFEHHTHETYFVQMPRGKLLVNGQKVLSLKRLVDGKHMKQANGMVSISLESRITLNVSWTGKSYPANLHLVKQPLFRLLCEWVKIIRTEKKLFSIIVFNYRGLRKRERKKSLWCGAASAAARDHRARSGHFFESLEEQKCLFLKLQLRQ